ncbi:hypothetical protein Y032_0103g3514 [Ancylostoma ceylanicum]|uniref:Uncharacterized protein n=1 Tax=Ancylostoma ceylanicum TaxID=53326 RepID=A0A016TGT3_9BILA|nr:hypothetical protein Y032_0103g3514 [Ancylostoma ceylanicum]
MGQVTTLDLQCEDPLRYSADMGKQLQFSTEPPHAAKINIALLSITCKNWPQHHPHCTSWVVEPERERSCSFQLNQAVASRAKGFTPPATISQKDKS